MLDTMVKLSHNSSIAMDSTFSTNKYGVSQMSMTDLICLFELYTLNMIDDLNFTLHSLNMEVLAIHIHEI